MSTLANLPTFSSDYTLTPDHIQEFRTSGVALVRGLASTDEIANYRPAMNKAVAD